jgi:hypothetical protein
LPFDTHPTATDQLLAGIQAGDIPADIFTADAVLDATVPNWRFCVHGADAVRDQLARWYPEPGRFRAFQRAPLPTGELVEFTFTWTEKGVEHTCHQAHILVTSGRYVSADTMFCGGRWPAELVTQMNTEQELTSSAKAIGSVGRSEPLPLIAEAEP